MRHTLFNHVTLKAVAGLENTTLHLKGGQVFNMLGRNVIDNEEGKYFLIINQVVNYGSQPAEGAFHVLRNEVVEGWVPSSFKAAAGTLRGTCYLPDEEGSLILHSVWSK